jgi:CheY-like chemotaxis protein
LNGRTVLLVEDESMVSMLAEDVFLDAGCVVLLAMRLGEALELARSEKIDFAVLDVNLGGGETSYPVAELLEERNVPYMFATGYAGDGIDPRFSARPQVQKPYAPDQLVCKAAELRLT